MDIREVKETNKFWERIEVFLDAAYRADYSIISNSLAHGLSPDIADDDYITVLQIASAQGNLPIMQILLNHGASVDKCNYCGFTPLLHAARNGKAHAVELLIRHGADPFRTTFYGTTALSLASAGGHLNVMAILRKYESHTRRRAPTPLIAAIAKKQYQAIIYLEFASIIQHPCRDTFYELDAFRVAEQLMDLKMRPFLYDLGLQSLNQPSRRFINQMSQVEIPRKTVDIRCLIRDHQVALIDWIMDLDDFSELPAGTTPLMYAAIVGSVSMVQTLLQHNCDINAAYYGFTSIMIAIVCGNDELTQYLIRKGANQNTDGYQFSLFELASNSDGISSTTVQLLLTGSEHRMSLIKRISAILQKISRRKGMNQSKCHQPIKLETDSRQLSFLQKVIQNMGLKPDWIPEELFDALAWPDYPCSCFEVSNTLCGPKAAPTRLLEERIMISADEQEQARCLLSDSLYKRIKKNSSPTRSSNFEPALSPVKSNSLHIKQQQCYSISKFRSILFQFGHGSPKNIGYTTSLDSTNFSTTLNAKDWQDDEISVNESINELNSAYKYEEKYWDILNKKCPPYVCQKLQEQDIDYETFLMLTKTEFISFGISLFDTNILICIQKVLEKELNKI
ncbi:ankyrin repeat protein [Onchocerca flexuosa]|uniref:Ankyrin repeat protein n=2 Tax=Onchocerca flexuosa TaxID=387005 RepID=A0A183H389_9BILA|nr:ankyrin repeat protein [Onchocerca flexuosa]VDO31349.1 unnamed protein product [Onchocerca flexuosa]